MADGIYVSPLLVHFRFEVVFQGFHVHKVSPGKKCGATRSMTPTNNNNSTGQVARTMTLYPRLHTLTRSVNSSVAHSRSRRSPRPDAEAWLRSQASYPSGSGLDLWFCASFSITSLYSFSCVHRFVWTCPWSFRRDACHIIFLNMDSYIYYDVITVNNDEVNLKYVSLPCLLHKNRPSTKSY